MRSLAPLLLIALIPACGMQGDLYEPAPPAAPPAEPAAAPQPTPQPTPEATDKGARKTIPATPDPAKSL